MTGIDHSLMTGSPLDDHFHAPRNAGVLDAADITARAENPVCGDRLVLYLRLGEARGAEGRRVEAASFQAYGCPAAIAAGSVLTELALGRGARELAALDAAAIDRALGGLDGEKRHACILGADAAGAAARAFPRGAAAPGSKEPR